MGTGLLAVVTILQMIPAMAVVDKGVRFLVCIVLALVALVLLIDTLFLELPFEKTYLEREDKPVVYDKGMYALCRHPGVIWFFLFYLFLGLALLPEGMIYTGMLYNALNVLYVMFQDIWTFPKTFCDYDIYKKETPFLIPNAHSVRCACQTWRERS